jgi:hypothetical protein
LFINVLFCCLILLLVCVVYILSYLFLFLFPMSRFYDLIWLFCAFFVSSSSFQCFLHCVTLQVLLSFILHRCMPCSLYMCILFIFYFVNFSVVVVVNYICPWLFFLLSYY